MKEKEKYDIRKYYNKNRMKKKIIRNKSNSAKRKYVLPQQGSVNNWEKLLKLLILFPQWQDEVRKIINKIKFKKTNEKLMKWKKFQWKTTFNGRWSLADDGLSLKSKFNNQESWFDQYGHLMVVIIFIFIIRIIFMFWLICVLIFMIIHFRQQKILLQFDSILEII